jgi:hypothetical protein
MERVLDNLFFVFVFFQDLIRRFTVDRPILKNDENFGQRNNLQNAGPVRKSAGSL